MTNQNNKKKDEVKSSFNPIVAAVTGAVVGASVAVVGAVALTDKKNREKVKEVLTNVKDQAAGYIHDVQEQVQDKKVDIEEKLSEGKKKVQKLVN